MQVWIADWYANVGFSAMAFANRCRPHVVAIARRCFHHPSRSHHHFVVGSPLVADLSPSYYGGGSREVLRRHFSWWRTNAAIQPIEEATTTAPVKEEEETSSIGEEEQEAFPAQQQETSIGEEQEVFPWHEDKDLVVPPRLDGLPSINDGTMVGGSSSSAFWSTLQVPVDAIVVTLDRFQTATQVPWWLTIIGSTLALRAALFPLTVTQLRKASLFARLGNQLPPPVPPRGSGLTMASQYQIFTKRRRELGVPSPAWLIAVPLIQVPLFIYWIVAVRQMAMAAHPGFDTGGVLWFADLTVPVQGALGALFPVIVAATYFTNLQISFKGMEQQKGVMGTVMKFYKWWLEAATIPAFIFGFYLPQGVFMYWITNNCWTLAQTVALRQPGVRAALGLPELSKLKISTPSPSPETSSPEISSSLKMEAVENMSADDLLVLAANCVAVQKEDEALEVLHHTVKKFPDKVEALFALGKIYTDRKAWVKASEYHGLVLQKTKEKELIIAASLGAGVALFNLGKRSEALDTMSVFLEMEVPKDPRSQHRYFKACIALSSVLSQEGRKQEALNLLRKAAKYEPMVEKVFIPQLEKELQQEEALKN